MTLWQCRVISHQQHATQTHSGCGFAWPPQSPFSFLCANAPLSFPSLPPSLPPRWQWRFISLHMCLSLSLSIPKQSFLNMADIFQSMSQIHDIDKDKKPKMAHAMKRRGEEGRTECLPLVRLLPFSCPLFWASFLPLVSRRRPCLCTAALQTHFSLGSAQKGEHETRVRCAGES